jgi:hypothetical protein
MDRLWTKRNIAIYVGAIIIGSIVGHFLPGSMMTRFFIALSLIVVTMVVGIYFLNKSAKSDEAHSRH